MALECKYDELRLRTDRQLVQLANAQVDLGMSYAREALQSAEVWASAKRYYCLAELAHLHASRLIGLTRDIGEDELIKLEAGLARLRDVLEGLSVLSAAAVPTGDKTPALARALWKAKGCPEGSAEEDWFQAERVLQAQAAC